ncbi:MAG: hypothetical protein ACK4X2_03975 [Bacteroidota bacterium]
MRKKFLEIVSRNIDNIYKEFEDSFIECIHYSESITAESLEVELREVISSIIEKLCRQLDKLGHTKLKSFVKRQQLYYAEYLPSNRMQVNYNKYLLWIVAHGNESILDGSYKASEKEIDYFKGVFKIYESCFFDLKAECESYFENLTGETSTTSPMWQDLINIELLQLIEIAEGKAKPNLSNIRCAAFCEVLYEKKYIKHTITRVKTMTQCAMSRYGRDIGKSLLASKKKIRKNYKTHPIAGQKSIESCF